MEDRSAVITVRIEPSLKTAFERMCAELDRTPSQMLRGFIRQAAQQHASATAQGALDLDPTPTPQAPPKKPAKGQKMASMKPANWRKG